MARINSRSSNRKDGGFINNNSLDFEELPTYQAMSSDEIAFVKAAANRGIVFYGDDVNKIFIKCNGVITVYEKLSTLEFTSVRRRMSVIVKDSAGQVKNFSFNKPSVSINTLSFTYLRFADMAFL